MSTIPDGLRTDRTPPISIPLQHFLVGLCFLVVGIGAGTILSVTALPGLADVAQLHLLLVGWIALTIMGAMTQFVPVWSGVALHSKRLATAQLWLVVGGLVGFAAALATGSVSLLPIAAGLLLAGVWLFVYTIGRTLLRARPLDRTERHFAFALFCFAALAPLGTLLAASFSTSVLESLPVTRGGILLAHATVALYGAVLVTIAGALSQLATMFTQTEYATIDRHLLGLEELALYGGVAALAVGRGVGLESLARAGALAVLVGAAALGLVIARALFRSTVERSPMTARYWVVVGSLLAWAVLAVPAWWRDPTGQAGLFGAPGTTDLLVLGVFGFVVVGTLYHVIPFIVWLEHYSDRIGLEPVPTIDDLYSSRLERADFGLTLAGFLVLAVAGLLSLPTWLAAVGGALASVGFALFAANMVWTLRRHGPGGVGDVVRGTGSDSEPDATEVDRVGD
ncbi:hypothetical protein C491_00727 [Natronococcus amylolyticus DSM 10524]|uniref:Uncharacterized protein n=1 Tax=Natronococcus amylolyticus DSM 10524 TaxID=1227497 RepID=L9XIA0_9EURY|nr:hypothetical protein [Natronococcus amylolyticus]ELY61337.1 hypothetical protein C491_00727 [Natronococcus amylolyticus DSM 10524]